MFSRSLTKAISTCVELLVGLGKGDQSQEVPVALHGRSDEVGDLIRAMQILPNTFRDLIRQISGRVQTLASASTDLSAASVQGSTSVKAASERA
jgi:methyl-accepting chemotaxis protein